MLIQDCKDCYGSGEVPDSFNLSKGKGDVCQTCKGAGKIIMTVINIKFEGIDDWHRAVFKDVNSRDRYGDVTCSKTGRPDVVIPYYKEHLDLLEYFGHSFGCEPNGGLDNSIILNIIE